MKGDQLDMYVSTFESTAVNSNRLRDYQLDQITAIRLYYDPALDPNPDDNLIPLELTIPITDDRVVVDTSVDGTAVFKVIMECNEDDVPAGTKFNAFHVLGVNGEDVHVVPTPPKEEENPTPEPTGGVTLNDNSGYGEASDKSSDPTPTEGEGESSTPPAEEGGDHVSEETNTEGSEPSPGEGTSESGSGTPSTDSTTDSTSGSGYSKGESETPTDGTGTGDSVEPTDPSKPTTGPEEVEHVTEILYFGTVPPARAFYSVGDTSTLDLTVIF